MLPCRFPTFFASATLLLTLGIQLPLAAQIGPDQGSSCTFTGIDVTKPGFFGACVSSVLTPRPLLVGDQSAACSSTTAGQIKYSSGALSFCNGSAWTSISGGAASQWTTGSGLIYYNGGNVGIGTASPSAKLSISAGDILLSDSRELQFGGGAQYAFIRGYSGNGYLALGTNGNTAVHIKLNGDVGIGTTNPNYKLHVIGSVYATSFEGSGASLSNLSATNLTSGTIAPARLGSGTPDSTTFLRGDGQWAAPAGGGAPTIVTAQCTAAAGLSSACSATVSCSGGTYVRSGGHSFPLGDNGANILMSYPSSSTTWLCRFKNGSSTNMTTYTCYAICS